MHYPEFHYRWTWHLQSSPEVLWPYISDTDHFNRDTGVPAVRPYMNTEGYSDKASGLRRRLQMKRIGVSIAWEEEPFEWVRPQRFGVNRHYFSGPMQSMRVLGELSPHPEGGTELTYQVWARPRNAVGLLAIPGQIGVLSAHSFAQAFHQYDHLTQHQHRTQAQYRAIFAHYTSDQLSPAGQARLQQASQRLTAAAHDDHTGDITRWLNQLTEFIRRGDDLDLAHLRPYQLADAWGAPRDEVLALCLHATRAGLLTLQWDLLCPLRRGAKLTTHSLSDVPQQVHCDACQIDFTTNLERSVELTFRPSPAVREVDVKSYCVGGPQVTPHIMAQLLLPPHAQRSISLALEPGRYRVRTQAMRGERWLHAQADGNAHVILHLCDDVWPADDSPISLQPAFDLQNDTHQEQLLIIERAAWSDQAVTVAEALLHQTFRDLFSDEVLRPGRLIEVGSLTLVFTDLRDSTRMYRLIGDAPAFDRVMNHFEVLDQAIAAEGGTLIKTVGDAVMAAFHEPAPALRAILSAQRALSAQPDPLSLKVGLHHGPCIAVTLNDRLDYFGSTVNIAARVQGLAGGGEIAVSDGVWQDPDVQIWWRENAQAQRLNVRCVESFLKGIDGPFTVWHIFENPMANEMT